MDPVPPTYVSSLPPSFLFLDHQNDLFVCKALLHSLSFGWADSTSFWRSLGRAGQTVKRYHSDDYNQLRSHLSDILDVYNYARRLKTFSGHTSYEYICKTGTSEDDQFILDPIHQNAGAKHLVYAAIDAKTLTTDNFDFDFSDNAILREK